jgi:hypothetical protein
MFLVLKNERKNPYALVGKKLARNKMISSVSLALTA